MVIINNWETLVSSSILTAITSNCVLFQRGNLTYLLCGDGGLCQALEQVNSSIICWCKIVLTANSLFVVEAVLMNGCGFKRS